MDPLMKRLDDLGRRHPRCMIGVVGLLALFVTLLLLSQDHVAAVLYQGF